MLALWKHPSPQPRRSNLGLERKRAHYQDALLVDGLQVENAPPPDQPANGGPRKSAQKLSGSDLKVQVLLA